MIRSSLLSLICLLSLPLITSGQAPTTQSLSVSPTLIDIAVSPGQIWQSNVKVINPNPYELTVYPQVVNFIPRGEGGQGSFVPLLESEGETNTLPEWIQISRRPVTIPPEQSQNITFSAVIPEDAPPGGHFGAILIGTQPAKNDGQRMEVRTSQIVSSLLFMRVAGDVVEDGRIRTFTVERTRVGTPNATFLLRFDNLGNVHLQPRGEITIYNMWGKERGVVPVNAQTNFGNVLPDSVRKFEFTWKGESSFFDIGRYKAVAALAYGNEQRKFESRTTYFWVIPIKALTITLGSIGAFFLIVFWLIRMYIRRMLYLSGIDLDDTRYRPHRRVSNPDLDISVSSYQKLSAPVRSGVNDFRTRLAATSGLVEKIKASLRFIIAYRSFFLAVIGICLFIFAVYIVLQSVQTEERGYEVAVETGEKPVEIKSEQVLFDEQYQVSDTTSTTTTAVQVINTSGTVGVAAKAALSIATSSKFSIASVSTDLERTSNRTVIVYNAEYVEVALFLSQLLEGALTSARPDPDPEVPITVFVGSDFMDR